MAGIGFMGLNVDDSRDHGARPRAGRDEKMERRRERSREGRWVGGKRGRDLQTNLITSLENGITLPALELLTSMKEGARQRRMGYWKKKDYPREKRCHIKGVKKKLKCVTSISATTVITVGLHEHGKRKKLACRSEIE